jgi:hypothetical protein
MHLQINNLITSNPNTAANLYNFTVYPTQLALVTVAISKNVRMLVSGIDVNGKTK